MKRGIITLLCYIAVSLPAYAQVQVLSLKTCIEKGLKNNYSLRIVKNDEQIAVNNATRANAGYLPTVEAVAGYDATLDSRDTRTRGTSDVTRERNIVGHNVNAGINAEWTIFDGYKIQTNYQRLQELKLQSATQTRMAIEDYIAARFRVLQLRPATYTPPQPAICRFAIQGKAQDSTRTVDYRRQVTPRPPTGTSGLQCGQRAKPQATRKPGFLANTSQRTYGRKRDEHANPRARHND